MEQTLYTISAREKIRELKLPPKTARVLAGVRWGNYAEPFTPAYWKASLWLSEKPEKKRDQPSNKEELIKEVVFCLLGGFGIKAEASYAFQSKLLATGLLLNGKLTEKKIVHLLKQRAAWGGRNYSFRFPNTKGRYIHSAIHYILKNHAPSQPKELRDWLLQIPGIGHKTAGWIVRNHLNSDEVAIIDIHLHRAGRLMELFDDRPLNKKTYHYFENRFIRFASALNVKASALDMLIWDSMRQYSGQH